MPLDNKAVLDEINGLTADLNRIKEEHESYDSVTKEFALKKEELSALKDNLAKYNETIAGLLSRKQELEKEIQVLNSNLVNARTASSQELSDLEAKRVKAVDEVAAIDKIILEKNRAVDSLTKQIILIQNELANVTREAITKKAELDRSISEREDEINALNSKIAELEKSVQGLEEKVKTSKSLDEGIAAKTAVLSELDIKIEAKSLDLKNLMNELAAKQEVFDQSVKQKTLELDERAGELSIKASSLEMKEDKLQKYKLKLEEFHGKPIPKLVI